MAAGARAGNGSSLAERVVPLLAVVALVFGLVAGPAGIALGDEDAKEDAEPVEVTKTAYWTNSPGEALPGILYDRFPPQVVCLVIPELCTSEIEQITSPIDALKPDAADYPTSPVQPVSPGSFPVARFGGVERYISAMHFELPPTPDGMEIDRLVLLLTETTPSYALDSPAFRQIAFSVIASVQAGAPAVDEFLKVLTEADEHPVANDSILGDNILEVEACALLEEFEEGGNKDWESLPARECVVGDTGTRDEDGIWSFDLTFAAQAWDGAGLEDMENYGIAFGPLRSQNVAWGDPDVSDNAQISFAGPESDTPPVIVVEYREAFDDTAGFDETTPPADTFGDDRGDEQFTAAPPSSGAFSPPADGPSDFEPVAADRESGGAAADVGQQPVAAAEAFSPVGDAEMPLYVWLLLPAALAGMYVMSRALTAVPVLAQDRPGAMSRLIEQRVNGGAVPSAQVQRA